MIWTDELREFILLHRNDDPLQLVLQQKKYPQWDMKFVAQQVEGYRMATDKIPSLAAYTDFVYPQKLNREQCSSEITATFKGTEFATNKSIADITGGLGIDSIFMAKHAKSLVYIEQNEELYTIASHNFKAIHQDNITPYCGNGIDFLQSTDRYFDLLYIDPARRDDNGKKVSAFENCTPNILENMDFLLGKADKLLIKSSPMLDILLATKQLQHVEEIIILAVKNECKEVLFLCSKNSEIPNKKYTCININSNGSIDKIVFDRDHENELSIPYTSTIHNYIYDPNVALLKGGAFKTLSQLYDIPKLHRNTHLYTSDKKITDFPGRIFKVIKNIPLSAKEIATAIPDGKAHVVTRNYPTPSEQLQKKLKLKEGGNLFVIALTKSDNSKTIILCEREK